MDEMAAGSRRENTAPAPASIMGDTAPTGDFASSSEDAALASIIEETIPGDIETSIRDEASTHANVLDPVSGKATVDEDSTMVAMFEDALITYGDRVYRVSETMQVPIDRFTGTDSRQERIQDRNGFKTGTDSSQKRELAALARMDMHPTILSSRCSLVSFLPR